MRTSNAGLIYTYIVALELDYILSDIKDQYIGMHNLVNLKKISEIFSYIAFMRRGAYQYNVHMWPPARCLLSLNCVNIREVMFERG